MNLTRAQVLAVLPNAKSRIDHFLMHLNDALPQYDITTPARVAAFLAQVGHESLQLIYTAEIASGIRYEGRADLGNTQPGDGKRFKGRGLIQVTGRANYAECSDAMFGDDRLLHFPELLEDPRYAVHSACWFWKTRGLNELADKGAFLKITRRINGGTNGLAERELFYKRAMGALNETEKHYA